MTAPHRPAAPRIICPLCGGPNGCRPAASGRLDTACWCSNARFSPELLQRLTPNDRHAVCICASCAAAAAATSRAEPA